MKNNQLELPFQTQNLWREVAPRRRTEIKNIIATMIKQICEPDTREDDHEIAAGPKNYGPSSESKGHRLHQTIDPSAGQIEH